MSNKRILLIEDDPPLAQVIIDNLTFERFQVEWVSDGSKALTAARMSPPDLVLLDLTLPGRDGLELCGVLREGGRVPIIILSARSQKADKLAGLKLGADDYVTKPFDLEELLARIGALLRRCRPTVETLTLGQVHIDLRIPRATLGRDEMHLTHREFEVLRYLAERSEKIVHRDELLRQVWGYLDVPAASRSVDHAIARLRRKIEVDPRHPRYIRTAHGDGYSLSPSGQPVSDVTLA
jgi:DNA-binding response OmpR family regulator